MQRGLTRWLSHKPITYLRYVPSIIREIKNWKDFLLDYIGLKNGGGIYVFRNGTLIKAEEGTATGTIAVVFLRKEYGNITDRQIIVDIGANIGVFAIYVAKQLPNAKIYCFEPIRKNYKTLVENISMNRHEDRIETFNIGLAAKSGTKDFFISSSPLHTFVENSKTKESVSIDCITMKEVFEKINIDHIDLLKMNCEGAEYEILYSTKTSYLKKIGEIRLEYHNIDLEQRNEKKLRSFLVSKGFRITHRKVNSANDGFIWAEKLK
jgi:FkbM family methyltransferase